jgi:hypothetical protein
MNATLSGRSFGGTKWLTSSAEEYRDAISAMNKKAESRNDFITRLTPAI